jgi:hypothetical protein
MQKSRHDQLAELRPGTVSCAATEWDEILGNSYLIKILCTIGQISDEKRNNQL